MVSAGGSTPATSGSPPHIKGVAQRQSAQGGRQPDAQQGAGARAPLQVTASMTAGSSRNARAYLRS